LNEKTNEKVCGKETRIANYRKKSVFKFKKMYVNNVNNLLVHLFSWSIPKDFYTYTLHKYCTTLLSSNKTVNNASLLTHYKHGHNRSKLRTINKKAPLCFFKCICCEMLWSKYRSDNFAVHLVFPKQDQTCVTRPGFMILTIWPWTSFLTPPSL